MDPGLAFRGKYGPVRIYPDYYVSYLRHGSCTDPLWCQSSGSDRRENSLVPAAHFVDRNPIQLGPPRVVVRLGISISRLDVPELPLYVDRANISVFYLLPAYSTKSE